MITFIDYLGTISTLHYSLFCFLLLYMTKGKGSRDHLSGLKALIQILCIGAILRLALDWLVFSNLLDYSFSVVVRRLGVRTVDAIGITVFFFSFFRKYRL